MFILEISAVLSTCAVAPSNMVYISSERPSRPSGHPKENTTTNSAAPCPYE